MNCAIPNMSRAVTLVIFLLLASCQPAAVIPSPTPINCRTGDYREELISSGQTREYQVHIPATYQPEEPAALVLAFHGAGSSSEEFESYSGFSPVADRASFIVVYPQAAGEHRFWNTTTGPNNQDIEFVRDLIADLASRCNIDPNRIYASGHSNGGGMANRLACDISERIAAIGSVAGAYRWSEACSPARPVAVLGVHGTDDPIIPYSGFQGASPPSSTHWMIEVPIPQWASTWGTRNGCDNEPSVTEHDPVTVQHWRNCRAGANVILYTIHGGGHEWPRALEAAQVIWDFFVQHPLVW